MRRDAAQAREGSGAVPLRGDQIELLEPLAGVRRRGRVFHVDREQILVKWDDGRSGSLRPGVDEFRIVPRTPRPPR